MLALIRTPPLRHSLLTMLTHWRSAIGMMLLALIVALLAATYIGDSSSPYGMCYGTTGRAVPCEALRR